MKLNKKTKTADVFCKAEVYGGSMLYRRNPSWETKPEANHGYADCLWRTSIGAITYNDDVLIQGVMNCFVKATKKNIFGKKYDYVQAFRHIQDASKFHNYCDGIIDKKPKLDVSRDQIIMGLTAMKLCRLSYHTEHKQKEYVI